MALTLATLTQKINWRLVAVHLVAIFFLVMASKRLAVLNDPVLLDTLVNYGPSEGINELKKADYLNFTDRLLFFNIWISMSVSIGLLLGLIVSSIFNIRRKHHWLNTLIVTIVSIILCWSGLPNSSFVGNIISLPALPISSLELKYKYLLTGSIPLLIAMLLFFNKRINNWIRVSRLRQSVVPNQHLV